MGREVSLLVILVVLVLIMEIHQQHRKLFLMMALLLIKPELLRVTEWLIMRILYFKNVLLNRKVI